MNNPVPIFSPILLLVSFAWSAVAGTVVHHDLHITLDAEHNRFEARDRLTFPKSFPRESVLHLRSGLNPSSEGAGLSIKSKGSSGVKTRVDRYKLDLPRNRRSFTLHYAGRLIPASPSPLGQPDVDSVSDPKSLTSIYLDGNHYWYPRFGDELVSFSLTVEAPRGWTPISQGQVSEIQRKDDGPTLRWEEQQPQDDIYLLAAPYHSYKKVTPVAETQAYLLQPDPQLAERYLTATAHYLDLYSRLIGPYPYSKFALVENSNQTGYGMPSFTLLGSRVIRLPFILHSSYPHEILHNWWGNGVYVDTASGNWSEGLTAYLADHLIKEQRGMGTQYRRSALQKYADYVAGEQDFSLSTFRARHGEVSQAVGYNKALMFFHMLRRDLGNKTFVEGLQRFYQDNRFRRAGYPDLRKAFEAVSGKDLRALFHQWIMRVGAPALDLEGLRVTQTTQGFILKGILLQRQADAAYLLKVPLAIHLDGVKEAYWTAVTMDKKRLEFSLELPSRPVRLEADPEFDLFRRLHRDEIPPSLGRVFGAEKVLFVLPSAATDDLRTGYRELALAWSEDPESLVWDNTLEKLPADRAVWIFGWKNKFQNQVNRSLDTTDLLLRTDTITVKGRKLERNTHSVVLISQNPPSPGQGIGWIGCENPRALPGLGRKLPHYSKYSYLAFEGDTPTNVLKGQWPVYNSPLHKVLAPGGETVTSVLPPAPPLTAISSISLPPRGFRGGAETGGLRSPHP